MPEGAGPSAELCARILGARDAGDAIVRVERARVDSPEEAAHLLGLRASAVDREIDAGEARMILQAVLSEDMAYGVEIINAATTARLAAAFLQAFDDEAARWFTNATWRVDEHSVTGVPSLGGWFPATSATFDSGVLVVTATRIGCAWFMDED
jgi:hypothetical protein